MSFDLDSLENYLKSMMLLYTRKVAKEIIKKGKEKGEINEKEFYEIILKYAKEYGMPVHKTSNKYMKLWGLNSLCRKIFPTMTFLKLLSMVSITHKVGDFMIYPVMKEKKGSKGFPILEFDKLLVVKVIG